jgi:hypothetical protein
VAQEREDQYQSKYSKSKSLSSLESFEGPPIFSDKSLIAGALLDPTDDPEATEDERGTEPEREPRGTEPEREPRDTDR